jgi:dihydroorotase
MCDFALLGVVHQTNADDILPMAKRGAIGYKIFFGETIGNLPFPDDGMCQIVFPNITKSGVPLCIHAENRQIQHFWTNKLKAEGKNDPIYWESSRPWLCEAESIAHAMFLAENFGTKLHIVHASTKQAVQMLRNAKARGLRFTGETQPHYLLRVDTDLKDVGPLLKMNPPVRSKEHQDALWEGLLDGSIDMIATDHSPHTLEEKGCDINGKMTKSAIWDCISGFCGVETNVPLILTQIVAVPEVQRSLARARASSTRSGVNGWCVILAPRGRSASLTATQTAPIAPISPASPMPLAPSLVDVSGVSTWATTMSGIS